MSDNQKGITILISLFLFMLLSIFALNMAQMIAVDTNAIAPTGPDQITGMGPKKEIERLQAMYLAQAGINHLHRRMVDIQRCVTPDPEDDPNCEPLDGWTSNFDDPAAANRTGAYRMELSESTGNYDTNHTLLPNLNMTARGYVPDWTNTTTDWDMELDVTRSARAFGEGVTQQSGSYPVNFINTSDNTHCSCLGGNCTSNPIVPGNCENGLDKDMGARSTTSPYNPPTGAGSLTSMKLGNPWVLTQCASGFPPPDIRYCYAVIDFGMEVDVDELRWLNRSRNYVNWAELSYWDSTTGMWIDMPSATGNERSYPDPEDAAEPFVPYYMKQWVRDTYGDSASNSGNKCPTSTNNWYNDAVYNGDRCTNFLDPTGIGRWFYIPSNKNPCTVLPGDCTNAGGTPVGNTQYRSYIARIKLNAPVRTRRIQLEFDAHTAGTTFVLEELGVYCCDNDYSAADPFPSPSRNVIKETHGIVRAGLAYTYTPPGPPVITYLNPNSAAPTNPGEIDRENSNFP